MGNLLNPNNPVMRFIGKAVDCIILSMVFTLCCLPIVTIGPALTGLYYAVVKNIRRDRSYAVASFFKGFKDNLKQGIPVGLIFILLTGILCFNIYFTVNAATTTWLRLLRYFYLAVLVILWMVGIYLWPVLSRVSLKIKDLFRMCLFFAFRHFLTTIVCLIVVLGAAFLIWTSSGLFMVFVPAITALIISFSMEKILKRYTPDTTDEDADTWYLE